MDSNTDYVPFSNPQAVTAYDGGGIDKRTKKRRAWRVLVDMDAPAFAVFVRDEKGKLPAEPQYVSQVHGLANYYAKYGQPHPDASAILKAWEDAREPVTDEVADDKPDSEESATESTEPVTDEVAEPTE